MRKVSNEKIIFPLLTIATPHYVSEWKCLLAEAEKDFGVLKRSEDTSNVDK